MSRRAARFHLPAGEPEAVVVFMSPKVAAELLEHVHDANEEYDTRSPALNALTEDIARSLVGSQWEQHYDQMARARPGSRFGGTEDDLAPAEDAIAQLRAMKATELYRGTEDVDAEEPGDAG